jgi:hypothetical protein
VKGFWRGNKIHIFEIIPRAAVQFSLYENIKRFFYIDGSVILPFYCLISLKMDYILLYL